MDPVVLGLCVAIVVVAIALLIRQFSAGRVTETAKPAARDVAAEPAANAPRK